MARSSEPRRTENIEVALTPDEKMELIEAAKSEGLQTSTFVRLAALQMARRGI